MIKESRSLGITLIELLVVIAIIAVLAAILFPIISRAKDKAGETTDISNLRQLAAAGAIYSESHNIPYPLDIHVLVKTGQISKELIISPRDSTPRGIAGEYRAIMMLGPTDLEPVDYRFSYLGPGDIGHRWHMNPNTMEVFEKGTNIGWLMSVKGNWQSIEFASTEGVGFMRLLPEGSVLHRIIRKFPIKEDGTLGIVPQHFWADFDDSVTPYLSPPD